MQFTVISDTHNKHRKLKLDGGDVLLHCGDFSGRGSSEQITEFNEWLGELDFHYKIVIAGNHDFLFENNPQQGVKLLTNATYLQDSSIQIEGLKIYGSPWQPWFHNWAFNLQRGEELIKKWALIPSDTDILLTHGPPYGIGDMTSHGENVGCKDLLERVRAVQPAFHCFGHIHEENGIWKEQATTFINASICDLSYKPGNPFYTFEL